MISPRIIPRRLNRILFSYRYDIFTLLLLTLLILAVYSPLLRPGHIVFSDLDFPADSSRYLEQVSGMWNHRWNTATQLNLPRLFFTSLPWLISAACGYSGAVFVKSFIMLVVLISAISMYLFCKRLFSVYVEKGFSLQGIIAIAAGAFFYAVNPWILTRIQHLYLLCGYCLLPLALVFFFNLFDPKFQDQLIKGYRVSRKRLYRRNIIDSFLAALTISVLSAAIHYFFYVLIMYTVLWTLLLGKTVYANRKNKRQAINAIISNYFAKAVLIVVFLCLFSMHWLVVYVIGIFSGTQGSQYNINVTDTLMMFSRHSDFSSCLYLNSYWWPMFELKTIGAGFYFGGGIIIVLVIIGFFHSARKYNILLFFGLLTGLFLLFSTGTYYKGIDALFVRLVTETPVIGSMFRDANKLVGLAVFGYALFIPFAFHWGRSAFNNHVKYANYILFPVFFLAMILYIRPFFNVYLDGYYKPVAVPEEYGELNEYLDEAALGEDGDNRILMVPVADNMTQSASGVATYIWNRVDSNSVLEKASGDYSIYQLKQNTVFHHEGNIPAISYYFLYLQNNLDFGLTDNLSYLFPLMNVSKLVYQDIYLGQEARQSFNIQIVRMQKGLRRTFKNQLFSVYERGPFNQADFIFRPVINTEGICSESLLFRAGLPVSISASVFTSLAPESLALDIAGAGSYVFSKNPEHFWLSVLPSSYYLKPGLAVSTGNPLLGWSQTAVHTKDWNWQLSSQGITDAAFQFDFSSNIAMTYTSATLAGPNYRWADLKGETVLDFDTMLRLDLFFKPDNPDLFEIEANPVDASNRFPNLRGIIARGDTGSMWQVAKSEKIPVNGHTPYRFRIIISGRGTNQLHLKFRFYDQNNNELGISYAVAPGEFTNFDGLNFNSEYVSPGESAFMRIELLSRQRPDQKVYWWIHDLEIEDLSDFSIANQFNLPLNKPAGLYRVFARTFFSANGGLVRIYSNKSLGIINTKNPARAEFQWTDLGLFNLDETDSLRIENKDGFQGINLFAFVPIKDVTRFRAPARKALSESSLIMGFEAEKDFDFDGELQSLRRFPVLSQGNGLRSISGQATRILHFPKSSFYSFTVFGGYYKEEPALSLTLTPLENTEKFSGIVNIPIVFGDKNSSSSLVIENNDQKTDESYIRIVKNVSGELADYGSVESGSIKIPAGDYALTIDFVAGTENMLIAKKLRKFSPPEIVMPVFEQKENEIDCSACEKIDPADLTLNTFSGESFGNLEFTAEMQPTCSCDWYIISSDLLPVIEEHEYYLGYRASSENTDSSHSKILYLDVDFQVLATDYVPEIEENQKQIMNEYEHISAAPSQAAYMVVQWWARGDKEKAGILRVTKLRMYPLAIMPVFDALLIKEIMENKNDPGSASGEVIDSDSYIVNSFNSPSPLWRRADLAPVVINGLTQGHVVTGGSNISPLYLYMEKIYWRGLLGLPLAVILFIILYRICKHSLPLRRRFTLWLRSKKTDD